MKDWGFFDRPWMQMLLSVALFYLRLGELMDSCVVAGEWRICPFFMFIVCLAQHLHRTTTKTTVFKRV